MQREFTVENYPEHADRVAAANSLLQRAQAAFPDSDILPQVRFYISDEIPRGAQGVWGEVDDEGRFLMRVRLRPELLALPIEQFEGIVAHELGHAANGDQMHWRWDIHNKLRAECSADLAAVYLGAGEGLVDFFEPQVLEAASRTESELEVIRFMRAILPSTHPAPAERIALLRDENLQNLHPADVDLDIDCTVQKDLPPMEQVRRAGMTALRIVLPL